jgi:hypothetical protein
MFAACLILFFFCCHLEDGGTMFIWNVGWLSSHYTALYRRKYNFFMLSLHKETKINPLYIYNIRPLISLPKLHLGIQWNFVYVLCTKMCCMKLVVTHFFHCGSTAQFWTMAASIKLSVSFRLLDLGESAWLLGRVISSSQGLCLSAPGDCEDGEVGGMNGFFFWQGKPKYSEKTCPDANLSTTNHTCQTQARTRAAAVGSQRLTASTVARPVVTHTDTVWPVNLRYTKPRRTYTSIHFLIIGS